MNMPNCLFYKKPAQYWTQALPLGNGSIGAMCYSGVDEDKISLNHDTLWTGHPRTVTRDGAYESYVRAQKMVRDGKYHSAHKELEKNFTACWSQAYMPFGNIVLHFGIKEYSGYERRLNLSEAMLTSSFTSGGVNYKKTTFISHPGRVMLYRIETNGNNALSFTLSADCPLKSQIHTQGNFLVIDGECPGDADTNSENYPCNALLYSDDDYERGILFRGAIGIESDGVLENRDGGIAVQNANYANLYFCVETSFNGFDKYPAIDGKEYKNACLTTLENAIRTGYEHLKNEHTADYKSLYDRMELTLGGNDCTSVPTDKRLNQFVSDKSDIGLYTLLFNFGRYLLISSSRSGTTATNLQGIWSDSISPPWNSNYTVNINTQMNYWGVAACNMPELMQPLVNLIKSLSVTGEVTAREFYHADGFVVHHNTDIWGHSAPVKGSPSWSFWNGASGWLCRALYELYEYTDDKEFLRSEALPIMKKAAKFYLDILVDDGNGNLIISPATSPENHFFLRGKRSAVAKSTAMMNSIVLDLLNNCKKACEILDEKDDFYSKICCAAGKILPLQIGKQGEVLEWNEPLRETEVHHRHLSHLYALHPANLITYDNEKMINACKKTLQLRGDGGTGWSLAWKINLFARLRDGNHALSLINTQLHPVPSSGNAARSYHSGGTYANMFDAHPPFQIDGNFGAVSGICEMLLQSDGKNVYLLPALPDRWGNGSVRGIRAKGNVTADIAWKNGKITNYKIHGDTSELNIIPCR